MVSIFAGVSLTAVMAYVAYHLYQVSNADNSVSKAWPKYKSRDAKGYVKPDKPTFIHEPKDICARPKDESRLFLLIIVHSGPNNFGKRENIRKTWGCYKNYKQILSYINGETLETKENITKQKERKKRYEYDKFDNEMIADYPKVPELEIDKSEGTFFGLLCEDNIENYFKDYEYTNNNNNSQSKQDYRIVFLLGSPHKQETDYQIGIEEEVAKYGDILQEINPDTYQTLSIKSVFMLKWLSNKCNDSVRYVLKTDDDIFVNVPYLVINLEKRAESFDIRVKAGYKGEEYSLMGNVNCGYKPVKASQDKWYTPYYLYNRPYFPCFASGMGYVMTPAAARALYKAALDTPIFHIEDVYITGMCRQSAKPDLPIVNLKAWGYDADCRYTSLVHWCKAFRSVFCHDSSRHSMYTMAMRMLNIENVERCQNGEDIGLDTYRSLVAKYRNRSRVFTRREEKMLRKMLRLEGSAS